MTVSLEQLPSQPVLVYHFEGHVTLHDLMAVQAAEESLFSAVPERYRWHVILDMRTIDTIAAPLFPKLQQMHLARDPRVVRVVVVGANPYLRALVNSLDTAAPHHASPLFCNTLEAALELVRTVIADAPTPAVNAQQES